VHLVESQPPEEAARGVAGVEVAHFRPPAIHRLHAARRGEYDVAVGKVGGLKVGEAEPVGDLADPAGGHLHLVEVVVVATQRLFPCEEDLAAIPGDGRVADRAPGIRQQRARGAAGRGHLQQAEFGAGQEVAFRLGVGLALGVGEKRWPYGRMLGEHDARRGGEHGAQAHRAAGLARPRVQVKPAGVPRGGSGGGERGEFVADRDGLEAGSREYARDHAPRQGRGVAGAGPILEPVPRILPDPILLDGKLVCQGRPWLLSGVRRGGGLRPGTRRSHLHRPWTGGRGRGRRQHGDRPEGKRGRKTPHPPPGERSGPPA